MCLFSFINAAYQDLCSRFKPSQAFPIWAFWRNLEVIRMASPITERNVSWRSTSKCVSMWFIVYISNILVAQPVLARCPL